MTGSQQAICDIIDKGPSGGHAIRETQCCSVIELENNAILRYLGIHLRCHQQSFAAVAAKAELW